MKTFIRNENEGKHTQFLLPFILILFFVFGLVLSAQSNTQTSQEVTGSEKAKDSTSDKENANQKENMLHYEVVVTATGTPKDTFETPQPVSVISKQKLMEKAPNNISDALLDLPGIDVNGVGANQTRPVIRGLRGQRILLMEDGIRMNNSRRQQNFGEIPALIDISGIERIEVVRGPASVLYGSDAIGGVINIITRSPQYDPASSQIHGSLGYRYSSSDNQNKAIVGLSGNLGKLGIMLNGNFRKANDYKAPAGDFGNIHLAQDVTVTDSGVKDKGMNALLNYQISSNSDLSLKYEFYDAKNAGFGFIEPSLYDPGSTRIQILYPMQKVERYSVKYESRKLGFLLADSMSFTTYHNRNKRSLTMDVFVPFGIPSMPSAGVDVYSENFTNVKTNGFRLELNKAISTHVITYGADFFQDSTANTDTIRTQMVGFGPPHPDISNTPQVPNARYRSIGAFIQDDIPLFSRTSLILGVRYQNVNAKTKDTPGLEGQALYDSTDQTLVGTANITYGITENLRLVFSVGRGFRSPNLIERFYNGVTPEGSGYQSRNTDLKAETSLNFDAGFKYRRQNIFFEASFFNNVVRDGIRLVATGNKVDGIAEYQNINVDKLRMQGIEVLGKYYFPFNISLLANYTYIKSKDLGNPETPYVDTYSSKFNVALRYEHPRKFFYAQYDLRVNGNQKDIILVNNPIGDIIPGFTVHTLSAGVTLFRNSRYPQQIGLAVENLTNTLYSEFSNASFFRPQPRRQIVLTWTGNF